MLDARRTAARDLYDLELLVARGVCPERSVIESLGGAAMVLAGVAAKIDLMHWPMFCDQVLPTLPRDIQRHIDEEEYLEMKVRLVAGLARCFALGIRE
jgi:hypothetical protein